MKNAQYSDSANPRLLRPAAEDRGWGVGSTSEFQGARVRIAGEFVEATCVDRSERNVWLATNVVHIKKKVMAMTPLRYGRQKKGPESPKRPGARGRYVVTCLRQGFEQQGRSPLGDASQPHEPRGCRGELHRPHGCEALQQPSLARTGRSRG